MWLEFGFLTSPEGTQVRDVLEVLQILGQLNHNSYEDTIGDFNIIVKARMFLTCFIYFRY